jgi:hypothetical protein
VATWNLSTVTGPELRYPAVTPAEALEGNFNDIKRLPDYEPIRHIWKNLLKPANCQTCTVIMQ